MFERFDFVAYSSEVIDMGRVTKAILLSVGDMQKFTKDQTRIFGPT